MDSTIPLSFLGGSMSGGEIMLVFVAILLLFGSKNVPIIARTIGKSLETFKKASRGITDEIMRADYDKDPPPARLGKSEEKKSGEPVSSLVADEIEPSALIKPASNSIERNEKNA